MPISAVVDSPVASAIAIRLFAAYSRNMETEIKQLDVSSAFIYGILPEPVYLDYQMYMLRRREGQECGKD
eukprot:snap_masked-scaffold_7-processed-gene-19.25-mRNA-1 protein AED:1.00 eAED:1.00 QI:0/-1/0/0/-1/1/1/0/69